MLSNRPASVRTTRNALLTLACAPLLALSLFPATPLHADAVWTAVGSGQWSTATNWSTNPLIPNSQDQNVLFSNATTAASTITLTSPITVGSLTFDPAFAYTLAASAANLTLSTSTGNATITVNHSYANVANTIVAPLILASPTTITNNDLPATSQNNLTLSGALSGSAPLTFNGPGQVVLSGNNAAYTGAITINNGTLFASSSTALGSSTSAADGTTINANATLAINTAPAVVNEFLTLNGGTLKANTSSAVTINAPVTLSADSAITSLGHYAFRLNSLVGSSNITLSTAAFTLAGKGPTSTFTGNLLLTNAASVNLSGSLATAQSLILTPGTSLTLALPVGTDPTLNSVAPGSILATGGELGVSTDIDFRPALAANATLTGILFNTNNATLGGSNSLDMNTFANPSTLRIGGTGSIASTMSLRPDLATHTYRFGLSDTPSTLTVNATLTDQDAAPNNLDINGGTTTLSANNTYSGTTTIANGTLLITNPNALGTASGTDADSTIINANGTLKLASNLTLANEKITVNPGGTLTANNSTATYANPITMNGGTLSNATFTGNLSGNANFAGSNILLAGSANYTANLTLTGNNTISSAAAISFAGRTLVTSGNTSITAPVNGPLQVFGGNISISANATAPISVTSGNVSILSAAADPLNILGGAVAVSAPLNAPISISNGIVSLSGNATLPQNSVTLLGGTVGFSKDLALSTLSYATSSAGTVAVNTGATAFTSGGSESIDFSAFPAGTLIHLGSQSSGIIDAAASLIPDLSHTWHFGGATGSLTVNAVIQDVNAIPTNVDVAANSTLILAGANTYTGLTTIEGTLQVGSTQALGSGLGTANDATVVTTGGTLRTAAGVTITSEDIILQGGFANVSTTGPIVLAADSSAAGSLLGTISGPGNLTLNASATIGGNNTSTGYLVLGANANLTVTSSNGLSATSGGIVMGSSATLNLNATTSVTISIGAGTLNANAPQTGSITLSNGTANIRATSSNNLIISSPIAGLGASTGATLAIYAAGSNNITQNGGLLALYDTQHTLTGPISVNNGYISQSVAGTININAPLTVSGAVWLLTQSYVSSSVLNLNGGVSGSGTLTIDPGTQDFTSAINFAGPLSFSGLVNAFSSDGRENTTFTDVNTRGAIYLLTPTTFSGNVTHAGGMNASYSTTSFNGLSTNITGTFYGGPTVNDNASFGHLTIASGQLQGNGTLSTNDHFLDLRGGAVNFTGTFSNITSIVKNGTGNATLMRLPTNSVVPISVMGGGLNLDANLTNSLAPITLFNNAILTATTGTFTNPIFLNNSNGDGLRGALSLPSADSSVSPSFAGPINLGTIGSSFGSGYVTVSGTISGGNLTLEPGLLDTTLTGVNTYTGMTNLAGSVNLPANLTLSGNGTLLATSAIFIGGGSALYLDSSITNIANRLPLHAPITFNGSTLQFYANQVTSSGEVVGDVTLACGVNALSIIPGSQNVSGTLTLQSLTRLPGAVLNFGGYYDYYTLLGNPASSYPSKILIANQAQTNFLGGAYTFGQYDFAKYTSLGMTSMSGSDYFSGPESAWTATTTASIASAVTLTGSRTVRAIRPDVANSTIHSIDLAGYTLNIASGGLIGTTISGVAGSRLTAGGSASTAELFITNDSGTIPVAITDNPGPDGQYDPTPGGPLDADNGSVSFVLSAVDGATANITLTGNNTYSGTTYINNGKLTFAAPGSLPAGNISLVSGILSLSTGAAALVGTVTVYAGTIMGNSTMSAAAYNLQSGEIQIPLAGSGTLIKTTNLTFTIDSLSNYTGSIIVNGGVLSVPFNANQTVVNPIAINAGTLKLATTTTLGGPLSFGAYGNLEVAQSLKLAPTSLSLVTGATITLDSGGTLTVASAADAFSDSVNSAVHLNIAGIGQIYINSGSNNVATLAAYAVTVAAGSSLTADTYNVSGGSLNVLGTARIRASTPVAANVSAVSALTIAGSSNAWTGLIDLENNDLIIHSTTGNLSLVANQIQEGSNGGLWNGTGGIISSAARAARNTALAYFTGAQYAAATGNVLFDGQPVALTDLLIKYDLLGDANADGTVDLNDLNTVLNHLGATDPNWTSGNFDGAPTIDLTDLNDVLNNLGQTFSSANAAPPAPTPEPTSLLLASFVALPLLTRRRRPK